MLSLLRGETGIIKELDTSSLRWRRGLFVLCAVGFIFWAFSLFQTEAWRVRAVEVGFSHVNTAVPFHDAVTGVRPGSPSGQSRHYARRYRRSSCGVHTGSLAIPDFVASRSRLYVRASSWHVETARYLPAEAYPRRSEFVELVYWRARCADFRGDHRVATTRAR